MPPTTEWTRCLLVVALLPALGACTPDAGDTEAAMLPRLTTRPGAESGSGTVSALSIDQVRASAGQPARAGLRASGAGEALPTAAGPACEGGNTSSECLVQRQQAPDWRRRLAVEPDPYGDGALVPGVTLNPPRR